MVKLGDFMQVLEELFHLRRSRSTHLAIDLYIILLSGQRYGADHQELQKGILALIEANKNKPANKMGVTFNMVIGKTGKFHKVSLNSQLCKILREFKWPGFHSKTKEIYARMSRWLGIKGYRLKDLVLNLAAKSKPDLRISQRIAAHEELITTSVYTEETSCHSWCVKRF